MNGPVSHLGTDWRDQWARVLRWHARLNTFRENLPEDYMVEARALRLDDLFAFFMNCLHLTDWLKNSGAKTKKELDEFFDREPAMRLCRDVANGLKHYRLDPDREPAPANPGWSTTESRMTVMPPEPARWFFVGETGWHDMFETADACVAAWGRFLEGMEK